MIIRTAIYLTTLFLLSPQAAQAYVPVEIRLANGLILKGGNNNYKGVPRSFDFRRPGAFGEPMVPANQNNDDVLGVIITPNGVKASLILEHGNALEGVQETDFLNLDHYNMMYRQTPWEVVDFSALTVDNSSTPAALQKFLGDIASMIAVTVEHAEDPDDYGALTDHIEITPDGSIFFVLGFGKLSAVQDELNPDPAVDQTQIFNIGKMPDMPPGYIGKAAACERLLGDAVPKRPGGPIFPL